jgi:phosphoenolpyruvate-protein kinase (PTS system EI component)
MTGVPEAAVLLAGLGLSELSMAPTSIPAVKQRLREITLEQARAQVEALMR